MLIHFPNMFQNIKNFYVHTTKKKLRRMSIKKFSVETRPNAKYSFISQIEVKNQEIDLKPKFKKMWDCSVIPNEEGKFFLIYIFIF